MCFPDSTQSVSSKSNSKTTSSIHIHDLNDDCLEEIFSYLPMDDLFRARCCSRWTCMIDGFLEKKKEFGLNHEVLLKKRLMKDSISERTKASDLNALVSKMPNLESVAIGQCDDVAKAIHILASNCPNI